MSTATLDANENAKRPFPVVAMLVLAVLGAAAGYAFTTLDPLNMFLVEEPADPTPESADAVLAPPVAVGETAFVTVPAILVSLGPGAHASHLRFTATLDTIPGREDAVRAVLPRLSDMMTTYLRALEPAMLERPSALLTIRAQLFRRAEIITGPGAIRDLLITEFVLN